MVAVIRKLRWNLKINGIEIKPLDILAYRAIPTDIVGTIIDWCSWRKGYSHVGIVIESQFCYMKSIEANNTNDLKGVGYAHPTHHDIYISKIHVYRYPGLNKDVQERLKNAFIDKVGAPYDAVNFPSTWWRSVACKWLGLKRYQKTPALFQDVKGYNCAELIATVFYEVLGIELCAPLHHTAVTPNDVARTKRTVRML